VRFLRRKQRLEPLPWHVCQFFAFHADECTPPVRVCKHALVSALRVHEEGGVSPGMYSALISAVATSLTPKDTRTVNSKDFGMSIFFSFFRFYNTYRLIVSTTQLR
jgi:hypothetical protein